MSHTEQILYSMHHYEWIVNCNTTFIVFISLILVKFPECWFKLLSFETCPVSITVATESQMKHSGQSWWFFFSLAKLFIGQHMPFSYEFFLLPLLTVHCKSLSSFTGITAIFLWLICLLPTFAPSLFSSTARMILLKCQVREDQPYNFFLCKIKPLKWSSRCYMICKLLDPVLLYENSSYFTKAYWPLLFNQTMCPPPHVSEITLSHMWTFLENKSLKITRKCPSYYCFIIMPIISD